MTSQKNKDGFRVFEKLFIFFCVFQNFFKNVQDKLTLPLIEIDLALLKKFV